MLLRQGCSVMGRWMDWGRLAGVMVPGMAWKGVALRAGLLTGSASNSLCDAVSAQCLPAGHGTGRRHSRRPQFLGYVNQTGGGIGHLRRPGCPPAGHPWPARFHVGGRFLDGVPRQPRKCSLLRFWPWRTNRRVCRFPGRWLGGRLVHLSLFRNRHHGARDLQRRTRMHHHWLWFGGSVAIGYRSCRHRPAFPWRHR